MTTYGPYINIVTEHVPTPDPADPTSPVWVEQRMRVGCYECGGFDGVTAPARLVIGTFTCNPADPTVAYRLVCGHTAI